MKLRITILKYHSWYLCHISLLIMLLPIQICFWSKLYYKFTREKMIDCHMRCQEWRQISLIHLLVNCHDVIGGIFDRWISPQERMKSPLKWHNLSGKTKKRTCFSVFFFGRTQVWHFYRQNQIWQTQFVPFLVFFTVQAVKLWSLCSLESEWLLKIMSGTRSLCLWL